jgi:hypothetical protein
MNMAREGHQSVLKATGDLQQLRMQVKPLTERQPNPFSALKKLRVSSELREEMNTHVERVGVEHYQFSNSDQEQGTY